MFPTITIESKLIPKSTFSIKAAQGVLDIAALSAAFVLAYFLRFDFVLPDDVWKPAIYHLLFVVPFQFGTMRLCGIHKFIWRYVGISETNRILRAMILATLPLFFFRFFLAGNEIFTVVPLSIIILDFFLAAGAILGLRLLRREIYENMRFAKNAAAAAESEKKSVLLIGAGRAGVMTLNEMKTGYKLNYQVEGFVDDDVLRQNLIIGGIKVVGKTKDIPRLVRELEIDHVIITIAELSRLDMGRIVGICESVPVKVKTIPALSDLLEEKVSVSRIRDVEVEDLLGRSPVELDKQSIEDFLTDKSVLITGAGGSIGSELVRQILRFDISRLILVERSEFALFNIENEIKTFDCRCQIIPVIGDIGDANRMRGIFRRFRPHVVFHAAAHKHVPMMETNVVEALKNNVLGTNTIGLLAAQTEVEAFVLISTDKAVNPTSVMGATKRAAELLIQDLNASFATRFVAVRFGNVINSNGSVIPLFREQIRRSLPITVTHKDMTRYFMTIPEASQLVLQAGAIGAGGEIFILDMGEPVKILDLAHETIRLSGLKPYEDVPIIFTGVRPGEKLVEELATPKEFLIKTAHSKIFIGRIASHQTFQMERTIAEIEMLCASENDQAVRNFLTELIPEASLNGTNRNLLPELVQSGEKEFRRLTTAAV